LTTCARYKFLLLLITRIDRIATVARNGNGLLFRRLMSERTVILGDPCTHQV